MERMPVSEFVAYLDGTGVTNLDERKSYIRILRAMDDEAVKIYAALSQLKQRPLKQ